MTEALWNGSWQGLNPAKLVVTKKDDQKTQEVVLSDNENPDKPGCKSTGTDVFLTHAAIPTWDYHLTNYDEEGNARVTPKNNLWPEGNCKRRCEILCTGCRIEQNEDADNLYGVSGNVEILVQLHKHRKKKTGLIRSQTKVHWHCCQTMRAWARWTISSLYTKRYHRTWWKCSRKNYHSAGTEQFLFQWTLQSTHPFQWKQNPDRIHPCGKMHRLRPWRFLRQVRSNPDRMFISR